MRVSDTITAVTVILETSCLVFAGETGLRSIRGAEAAGLAGGRFGPHCPSPRQQVCIRKSDLVVTTVLLEKGTRTAASSKHNMRECVAAAFVSLGSLCYSLLQSSRFAPYSGCTCHHQS